MSMVYNERDLTAPLASRLNHSILILYSIIGKLGYSYRIPPFKHIHLLYSGIFQPS